MEEPICESVSERGLGCIREPQHEGKHRGAEPESAFARQLEEEGVPYEWEK